MDKRYWYRYFVDMSRPGRIEYKGVLYHVLSRGNEQRGIFSDDEDRYLFLDTIGEMADRFKINIFAFVLMNKHYHLLIKTNRANLSKSMQWFGATYTRRFNNRHSRSGHLFQGRFKSIIIQNDAYLMQLSCYIHRNPLRAAIVERLADYKWSSYPAYAYKKKAAPNWLSTELILSRFKEKNRHKAYREKVQRYSKEEKSLWEDFRHGMFLGSKKFVNKLRTLYLPDKPHVEIPRQKEVAITADPVILLKKGAKILNCNLRKFKQSSRISPSDKEDRDLLVYLLWKTGMLTNEKIGRFFGLSYSSVSHRIRAVKLRLNKDSRLRRKFNNLNSQCKI